MDDCCSGGCAAPPASQSPPQAAPDRAPLIRDAFRLEWLTIAWLMIEAGVGVVAGIKAGNVVLVAFGLDSVIELASAGVLIWRLSLELRHGQAFSETAEHLASRIAGALLFALAAYVVLAAAWGLGTRHGESFSLPGFAIALAAIPVMAWLARRKLAIAGAIGSRALRADAIEAVTCGWLSTVVVASLAIEWLTGAWWVDSIGGLAIVYLLVKEAREAWAGDDCGCD